MFKILIRLRGDGSQGVANCRRTVVANSNYGNFIQIDLALVRLAQPPCYFSLDSSGRPINSMDGKKNIMVGKPLFTQQLKSLCLYRMVQGGSKISNEYRCKRLVDPMQSYMLRKLQPQKRIFREIDVRSKRDVR